ncbi:MAG: DUF805 domain-containing protein [Hyphomicrobiales bacterium]|nr:DUF805 domain-containing protein [Hyphomicrobiales bacterium]MCP4999294.1 DUF805 domain-containing protein [Hyphomicrobiales bacterium]
MQLVIFSLAIGGMVFSASFLADPAAHTSERNASETAALFVILVAVIYTNFSTCLNRLRDSGRSGLWYLTFLVPYAGTGLMIYFCGVEASGDSDEISNSSPPSQQHNSGPGPHRRNQVLGRG